MQLKILLLLAFLDQENDYWITFFRTLMPSGSSRNVHDSSFFFFNCKLNFAEMPSEIRLLDKNGVYAAFCS